LIVGRFATIYRHYKGYLIINSPFSIINYQFRKKSDKIIFIRFFLWDNNRIVGESDDILKELFRQLRYNTSVVYEEDYVTRRARGVALSAARQIIQVMDIRKYNLRVARRLQERMRGRKKESKRYRSAWDR